MMVAGNQAVIQESITSGVRTLTTNIILEMGYSTDLHREALIGTAVVLFVFILMINLSLSLVKRKVEINGKILSKKWRRYKHDPKSLLLFLLVCLASCITMIALLFIIVYILIKGIPHLTPELFDIKYTSKNVSLLPALINTLFITVLSLFFAVLWALVLLFIWQNMHSAEINWFIL